VWQPLQLVAVVTLAWFGLAGGAWWQSLHCASAGVPVQETVVVAPRYWALAAHFPPWQ
jgi:hypothetical protein